jgi:tRNA (guanine-N7-)-methyltransferase
MTEASPTPPARSIRSYVLRQGRHSARRQQAFAQQLALYGVDPQQTFEPQKIFGNDHPLVMEIGIGNGEALTQLAAAHPHLNFIGVEVHTPGVHYAMQLIKTKSLTNVRLCHADVMGVLEHAIADHSLARVLIWMPDPWPKKRHHKRRLIQQEFINILQQKLLMNGSIHFASDWADYVDWTREQFAARQDFILNPQAIDAAGAVFQRPSTRFAERGQRLGHELADLVYQIK